MSITELAPAKLNLTLDVGARRPDGYHEITSVMQSAAVRCEKARCMACSFTTTPYFHLQSAGISC